MLTAKDSLQVTFFTSTIDSLKFGQIHFIDTSITFIHQYDPLQYQNKLYATLTNIGLAHKNQVFTPALSTGYSLKNVSFEEYITDNNEVKYFSQYQPFTEIFYILGPQKEQALALTFSREMFRGFVFGLDFSLNYSPGPSPSDASPGPYLNNKTDNKILFLTAQYFTKNKRYGIIANFLSNKLVMLENGGLLYDSIFEQNLETDRRVIPVNLMNAKNKIKQSGFYVEQYFNLLRPRNDSVKRKLDAGHIAYAFHYQRNQMLYQDSDMDFSFYQFHSPINDSSITYDSVYQQRIRNQLKWSNVGYQDDPFSQFFQVQFGVNYDIVQQTLPFDSIRQDYQQIIPFASISLDISKIFRLTAFGSLALGDYNNGDYLLSAQLDQTLGSERKNIGRLHFEFDLISQQPEWFYQHFQSNFYSWNNNLNKQTTMKLGGEYRLRQVRAGARFFTIGNYTFLNDSIRPMQLNSAATLLQLFTEGELNVHKFGINGRLVYQTTNQPDAIRLPDLTGTANIFFKNQIFKKAAWLQTGFQLTYLTSYFADAYMPALRNFYVQNEKKIGNFLIADVYLTLEVKKARIFIKYAHLNSYFGSKDYFLSPNYPARDARFYFGVSWRFFN